MNLSLMRRTLVGSAQTCSVAAQQARTHVTYIRGRNHFIDPFSEQHEWFTISRIMSTTTAQDEHPYYRKEYLKPKEERFMRAKRVIGKRANGAVRGLVEFIDFKRSHKYT